MHWRNKPFREMLEAEDLYIPAGELAYFGHWITAPGRSRRFNARFFVALAPQGQRGSNDANETVHDVWITPREALERGARGEIELVTRRRVAQGPVALHRSARGVSSTRATCPRSTRTAPAGRRARKARRSSAARDPQYFEIHWGDPEETGADHLRHRRRRAQAARPLGDAPDRAQSRRDDRARDQYLLRRRDGCGDRPRAGDRLARRKNPRSSKNLKWILCTHTHLDHSPAAAAIKAATGAQILGRPAPAGQDATLQARLRGRERPAHRPGRNLAARDPHAGARVEPSLLPARADADAVHRRPRDAGLDRGDQSARRRHARLPAVARAAARRGHRHHRAGPRLPDRRAAQGGAPPDRAPPQPRAQGGRGARRLEHPSLDEMLPLVYDDVPERIHRVAARSLTAHLEKLVAEGAVRARGKPLYAGKIGARSGGAR